MIHTTNVLVDISFAHEQPRTTIWRIQKTIHKLRMTRAILQNESVDYLLANVPSITMITAQ